MEARAVTRIAAVSDVHYSKASEGAHADLLAAASEAADVLLLCGDLTDYGLREEAEVLLKDLHTHVRIPTLAVLGNHDFESGTPGVVCEVLEGGGVTLLDGACAEVEGVGFAGVCGFGGGFGTHMLNAWGEPLIKQFVQAAVDEALKLEQALAQLTTPHRVVLLHYSPICATVEGEPPEIFPFLGSSRLEAPLDRLGATVAFHGHAHRGAPEGQTAGGVPIYNVAVPVLKASAPERPPFRLFEVEHAAAEAPAEEETG